MTEHKSPQWLEDWLNECAYAADTIDGDSQCFVVSENDLKKLLSGMARTLDDASKLLSVAICPNCDGGGVCYDNHGNVCLCQWCDERATCKKPQGLTNHERLEKRIAAAA